MASKELASLLVASWVGQLRVDGGVLNVGMAQPVFAPFDNRVELAG